MIIYRLARTRRPNRTMGVKPDALLGLLQETTTAGERASILLAICRMLKKTGYRSNSQEHKIVNWLAHLKRARERGEI
jgi:hypothetical protein